MTEIQIIVATITASATLMGAVLTFLYGLFRERYANNRHNQQIDLERRRAKFNERKLALELYNRRELKIFEARLASYLSLFAVLMSLEKRAIPYLTPERAVEIEKELKKVFYTKVGHSLSASSIESLTNLRDSLIAYSDGLIDANQILEVRRELLRSLHRDLGRTGYYLGDNKPLIELDVQMTEKILKDE